MEIVDVIQNTTVMEQSICAVFVLILAGMTIFTIGGITNNKKLENICVYFVYADAFICAVIIILMIAGVFTIPGEETIVARIEDNYPFSEIYNNYKIIDKDKYSNIYYLVKLVK